MSDDVLNEEDFFAEIRNVLAGCQVEYTKIAGESPLAIVPDITTGEDILHAFSTLYNRVLVLDLNLSAHSALMEFLIRRCIIESSLFETKDGQDEILDEFRAIIKRGVDNKREEVKSQIERFKKSESKIVVANDVPK